ncbi:MAG: hypothetical protein ACP5SD_08215 [Elusimicrobiales bacterium]
MQKDITDKSFVINIFLIFIFLITAKSYFLLKIPPQIVGDSPEYVSVIKNISEGKGFSEVDPTDNQIKAYARRPPIFFYAVYIFNFFKDIGKNTIFLNYLSSFLIVFLSIYLSFYITKNKLIAIATGWLLSLNANILYNSLLIMSDTFFSLTVIIFILIVIYFINNPTKKLFLLMGISLGVCVLTRTVLKFYWIILGLLIFFYFFKSEDIKKRLKYLFLFIFSYSIIILPYHLRNYKKLKTLSIESYQGASAMWSIMPLIENTDYEKLYQKDISYKEILDILKKYDYPNLAEHEIRKRYDLDTVEYSKKLFGIAKYTIINNPSGYFKIFIKNIINNITSSSAYLKIIDFAKPGYYDKQHKIMLDLTIQKNNINLSQIKYLIPNLIFRILNLIIFVFSLIGIIASFKKLDKRQSIFLISFLSYIIIISSLSSSYDRYRLPIEFIINFYLAYFLCNLEDIKQNLSIKLKRIS